MPSLPLPGAYLAPDGTCRFTVWAPYAQNAEVEFSGRQAPRRAPLERDSWGYHSAVLEGIAPGQEYYFVLDGAKTRPDPASRWQPHGVHGPSAVDDPSFPWTGDSWRNPPLEDYVIYELHVGAFTPEGTFDAVIPYLEYLRDLGVTAVELMPVAQFPGGRNWGYDGVLPYAAQDTYGGPDGFRRLVDACHQYGLAVVLDVVYNHLGPEGNYLADFGPYFTDRYLTPWGQALNFDGPESDHVRDYFIQNAIYWTRDCHVDALRLDAVHAILDHAAVPFVEELSARVQEAAVQAGRDVYLIAESSDNDARLITERSRNGYGMDAQWSDDFHHIVHTLITGEKAGYYQDFGGLDQLAKAYTEGFIYSGEYSPYRRRRHGSPSGHLPAECFVVCIQNHDQVGNRLLGERLMALAPFEAQRLAAAVLLLAPNVPLLFMGEEYGETAPFQYFISHTDEALIDAVRNGRREEFADFGWADDPPDPQAMETFEVCVLDHALRNVGRHAEMLAFYKKLLGLRKSVPALAGGGKDQLRVDVLPGTQVLRLHRWRDDSGALALFNFADRAASVEIAMPPGEWKEVLETDSGVPHGSGVLAPSGAAPFRVALPPYGVLLFVRE
ncbi:MAG: malto-oligosyltrehalose trehalohydrolase [Dehalococcoidia bacterium]